jgi:Tol biopolymer transport system component
MDKEVGHASTIFTLKLVIGTSLLCAALTLLVMGIGRATATAYEFAFVRQQDSNADIYMMDFSSGHLHNLTNHADDDLFPDWSPDGSQIAFASDREGNFEIYVLDVEDNMLRRLTDDSADDRAPIWSPDGRHIVFPDSLYNLSVIDADGNHLLNLTNGYAGSNPSWSPDSAQIAFASGDVFIGSLDGDVRQLTELIGTYSLNSDWSNDGSEIAFTSGEHSFDINVVNVMSGEIRVLAFGITPKLAWSPNSSSLVFIDSENYSGWRNDALYLVDIVTGKRTRLTDAAGVIRSFDWSGDGNYIVFSREITTPDLSDRTINLYIVDVHRRLTLEIPDTAGGQDPVWRP